MSEKEMGAWYFWWHHMFGVPYSDDLLRRIEAERMRQISKLAAAIIEGFVFIALNSPSEVRKWKKGRDDGKKTER